MKKVLFLVFVLQAVFAFGQKTSNNLIGKFNNKSFWSQYSSLEFNGQGKVVINNKEKYEFFERNDSIVIMSDSNPIYLSKSNNQLVGLSKNVKKSTFTSDNGGIKYEKALANNDKRLGLVEQYYQINYVKGDKLFEGKKKGNFASSMQVLKKENQRLCDLDLDLGCIQVFVYSLGEKSLGLISVLWDKNKKEVEDIKPDAELEKLGNKIIKLGNPEGYGLLYSYYTLIGLDAKAKEVNDKGLKEGCKICESNK